MRFATTAAIPSLDTASRRESGRRSVRLLGLAIASLVPAVFWSLLIEAVTYWLGMSIAPLTVAIIGATIALFLFAVCAPLMLRNPRPGSRN